MSSDAVTISSLEVENVTKIKAVALEPSPTGLTVIGGKNSQGKTSVLDAICWALGGKRYEPERPRRDGSVCDPHLRVELSNGIVAERGGRNGALKVTDPSGARHGQALLDGFVESFALDLPRFMAASDKERALALLRAVGVEDELEAMDRQEAALVERRRLAGQLERSHAGAVQVMPYYADAPEREVDVADLAERHREATEANAANDRARSLAEMAQRDVERLQGEVLRARNALEQREAELLRASAHLEDARAKAAPLVDVDAGEIAEQIGEAEEVNAKVRANAARLKAQEEHERLKADYDSLTARVEEVRARRVRLLEDAGMPLEGLSVDGGKLTYMGDSWGSMSASRQLMVATAIVRRINPACGFVLVDKLEQMDLDTLSEFAAWCEGEGLQVIGTRVGTGAECTVVIEDGSVLERAF